MIAPVAGWTDGRGLIYGVRVPAMPQREKWVDPPATADLSEDRAWLDAFRAGDRHALERVFRCYAPLVFHMVRRGVRLDGGVERVFVSHAVDEDDVVQEVFLRLLSPATRASYDGIRPYAGLVRVVTRNTLVDHLRRRSRTESPLNTAEDAESAALDHWHPGEPLPDQRAVERQQRATLDEFRASLPEAERQLFYLRFELGVSQDDAALAMKVSRQNVRTVEKRLRERLRVLAANLGQ